MLAFDRYAPAIGAFFIGLALVALQFASVVSAGGSPITPELYGPAVYEFPAMAWAGVQFLSAVVVAVGAFRGGRCGAWLVIIGGVVSFFVYSSLAVLAQLASQGTIVQAACTYMCAPGSVLAVGIAARYLQNE